MIYLDNAATTFPKPPCVAKEIANCICRYCGNPGRSGHILSLRASEKIYECREQISKMFGGKPENVVFTLNTTYALNIAIKSLFENNSHILISNMEHNSVYRPIHRLFEDGKATYDLFNVLQSEREIIKELEGKKKCNTKMLIMTHISNVCGMIFPIKEIGEFCKKNGITFIVDAAQSAGSVKINISDCNISALCAPAHKGLYGPQGLGFVIFGDSLPKTTIIEGGNGINSISPNMGNELPESYEGGTLPTPLIAGLCASLEWLNNSGIEKIAAYERNLAQKLTERLLEIKGSIVFGNSKPPSGIVLYKNKDYDTNALSALLDSKQICARNGFHCSPLAHTALGTGDDGAIRFSFSAFNTPYEVDEVYRAIKEFCK